MESNLIKDIAKEFVVSHFGIPEKMADNIWDSMIEDYPGSVSLAVTPGALESAPFPFPKKNAVPNSIKACLIFYDGFQEFPSNKNFASVLDSIKSASDKYHADAAVTKQILKKVSSLERKIEKLMKSQEKNNVAVKDKAAGLDEYITYLPTVTGIGTDIFGISEQKVREEYLQKKNDYEIFVYTRNVFVRSGRELKSVQMDERIYRLLVIFLRQKDMLIPPIPLYRKSWSGSFAELPSISDERDVSDPLKSSISELRSLLKDVPTFEITKARFQGYICKGNFKFCVVISKSDDTKYTLSEAEEQEDFSR